MMFCCVYKLWLWAFDMHGLFQTQFTSAERPFATRQVSTLGATFHGGLRPRYVQSRAAGPTKSHFFLQRHAALSETRGRCSWRRRPWLSMGYSKQYAGAEQRCATAVV